MTTAASVSNEYPLSTLLAKFGALFQLLGPTTVTTKVGPCPVQKFRFCLQKTPKKLSLAERGTLSILLVLPHPHSIFVGEKCSIQRVSVASCRNVRVDRTFPGEFRFLPDDFPFECEGAFLRARTRSSF